MQNNKATKATNKADKLNTMLATAAAATTTATTQYAASSSKNDDGTNKQKRNLNATVRSVAVVTSASLNTCWIGTHLSFATKTNAQALNVFVKAPQQQLKVMQQASDLVLTIVATNVQVGNDLETAKLHAYNKYAALSYTMLCRKAKVETANVAVTTVATATA